ncbi:BrnT family toxin [Psychrobacter sp. DM8]|uniref:BrnT family toxin n=1 Tax=Psychrobacter sp. DM8 TaxID=3440636 RepID=UPI003F4FC0CB
MGRLEHDYLVFEWDDDKSQTNLAKHGLLLEDAINAYLDPYALTQTHQVVDGEQRWRTLGRVHNAVLLFIGHLLYDDELDREVVRLITVREATSQEERVYYDNH